MKKVIFLSALILSSNVFAKDVIGTIKKIEPFYIEKTEVFNSEVVQFNYTPTAHTQYLDSYNLTKFLDSNKSSKIEDKDFKMITLEAEDKIVYTLKMSSDFDVKVGEKIKTNIENL